MYDIYIYIHTTSIDPRRGSLTETCRESRSEAAHGKDGANELKRVRRNARRSAGRGVSRHAVWGSQIASAITPQTPSEVGDQIDSKKERDRRRDEKEGERACACKKEREQRANE